MQIIKLFCACWKGTSKIGKDLCNSVVFFMSLCSFAGIEMQKKGTGRGEGSRGGRALLSLNGKYNFYFRFGLCVL
jgi:hypothetical protein